MENNSVYILQFTSPSTVTEKASEEKKFTASLASAVISDGSIGK